MPTQSPPWASAVVTAEGYRDVSRLYEFADRSQAVLPLFAGRLPLSVRRSPPAAWGFGGLLATRPLSAEHVRTVLNDLVQNPAALTQIRPNPLDATIWREGSSGWVSVPRKAHVLDLAGGFQDVWSKRFSSGTRNKVRRAERAGVEIECGSSSRLISDFHALLRLSFERWGKRQHEPLALARWRGQRRDPESKFRRIAEAIGPAFRLWVARVHDEPAAAILVLRDREAHYTRGAMNRELAGPTYANFLLHCRAIEDACEAGCSHYHMGESGDSASIAEFKSHFGATAFPYAEYCYEQVPISWLVRGARTLVKRVIGFRDV